MKANNYIHEFLGTFILLFVGTGAIIADDMSGGAVTHVGISLAFGFVVLAMIYTIGDTSGAHINPAVTLGFMIAGRITWKVALGYAVSQVLGALAASACLLALLPFHETMGATLPSIAPLKAFLFEIILSFILMFVIARVASGSKEKGLMAGVAIGFTIALESLFAGPITGASMNPARSVAPAIFSGHTEHLWLYLLGPLLGSAAAVLLCSAMRLPCCPENEKNCR